jgi:predicted TIM-barrel fold metal-dependent hydrolase
MRIDVHTHAFHPKIADKVLAQLEDHYDIHPLGTGLVDDLIARLRTAGLDKAVVHTAATAPAQVVPANNWSIFLQRTHPELYAFGTLHPGFKDNWRELDRLEAEGIRGIKLHPDFQGFRLDDPALYPLLEALDGRFSVMVHVGDRLPPELNPSCPIKLAQIVRDFPNLTIVAAHMGGYLHWTWALEHLIGKDVYIDTSSCLDFIDDTLLHAIFSRHPRERILFGSDYPLFDPGLELRKLERRLKLGSKDLETLLSTAELLLREA